MTRKQLDDRILNHLIKKLFFESVEKDLTVK